MSDKESSSGALLQRINVPHTAAAMPHELALDNDNGDVYVVGMLRQLWRYRLLTR
jgi:hypothetical protein